MAQLGSALRSGRRGRWFKSSQPDYRRTANSGAQRRTPHRTAPLSHLFAPLRTLVPTQARRKLARCVGERCRVSTSSEWRALEQGGPRLRGEVGSTGSIGGWWRRSDAPRASRAVGARGLSVSAWFAPWAPTWADRRTPLRCRLSASWRGGSGIPTASSVFLVSPTVTPSGLCRSVPETRHRGDGGVCGSQSFPVSTSRRGACSITSRTPRLTPAVNKFPPDFVRPMSRNRDRYGNPLYVAVHKAERKRWSLRWGPGACVAGGARSRFPRCPNGIWAMSMRMAGGVGIRRATRSTSLAIGRP